MATVIKKVLNLIDDCDNSNTAPDVKECLNNLKCKIEQLQLHETEIINRAYMVGFIDKENNRNMQNNYYKQYYEPYVFIKK